MNSQYPIVIIGAGPVGLAAAARVLERGEQPIILEKGAGVAENIRQWAHVRVFSPWQYNVDPCAAALLVQHGWQLPDPDGLPTGGELIAHYLQPLADVPAIKAGLRLNSRVVSIARAGMDKVKTANREDQPFLIHVENADGTEDQLLARAVIDATGTYAHPNPMGGSGVPALGEKALAAHIYYGIPDVLNRDYDRYTNQRVLVVGSGHSAFNALLDLASREDVKEITWAIRRTNLRQLYGGGEADQLAARGSLGQRLRSVVNSGRVRLVSGFQIARLTKTPAGIVASDGTQPLEPVDEIVVATGLRPDLSLEQELRLAIDPALESVAGIAEVIDPNVHSCGTVPPHGAEQLLQPEKDFFIVGMKSYGRAPNFLMLTGYEQVRSVVAALFGDWESAREVQLVLPETGVCSTDLAVDGAGCCTVANNAVVETSGSACCTPATETSLETTSCGCGITIDAASIASTSGCCSPAVSQPIQLFERVGE